MIPKLVLEHEHEHESCVAEPWSLKSERSPDLHQPRRASCYTVTIER